jgi:hypothetical protein
VDLVGFEVFDDALVCPLEGQGEEALAALEVLGTLGRGVASERVDGGQTRVAARRAVAALCLEVVKEGQHILRPDVLEVEHGHRAASTRGEETQQERHGIPVASDGVGARASDSRKMVGEKAT